MMIIAGLPIEVYRVQNIQEMNLWPPSKKHLVCAQQQNVLSVIVFPLSASSV